MINRDRGELHTMTAGAWLPVTQAVITGVIAFVLVLVLAVSLRFRSPWLWASCVGVLAMGGAWWAGAGHWYKLTGLESFLNIDLDRDGAIGSSSSLSNPKREEVRVYVSELSAEGNLSGNQRVYDFPCTADELAELARGLLDGLPFSERAWSGAGRPFSVIGFRELRGEFIKRGLIRLASDKDARQGYTLTVAGRHVLQALLDGLPSPSDYGGDL